MSDQALDGRDHHEIERPKGVAALAVNVTIVAEMTTLPVTVHSAGEVQALEEDVIAVERWATTRGSVRPGVLAPA